MRYIDVRSDTVTQPTQEMRDAMRLAVVGDDVWGDDPTVNELEELAAERLGKQAALFVASGTQGNAVCMMAHTRRGDAVLMGKNCHIAAHEAGSYAMLAGVSPVFPLDDDEVLRPESMRSLIRGKSDFSNARTGLICVENALSNGNVSPVLNMAQIYSIAQEHGVPVHLDGARIFNAVSYLNIDVKEMTKSCDSVMCCLSKGLCAPVGSIVAGTRDFIAQARRLRKVLGGGMRQAGILAAAGIIALEKMALRLPEDHENAKYLAARLKALPGVSLNESLVKTNMIFFTADWPESVIQSFPGEMDRRGVKAAAPDGMFRFVTNNGVSRQDCDTVADAILDMLKIAPPYPYCR